MQLLQAHAVPLQMPRVDGQAQQRQGWAAEFARAVRQHHIERTCPPGLCDAPKCRALIQRAAARREQPDAQRAALTHRALRRGERVAEHQHRAVGVAHARIQRTAAFGRHACGHGSRW
ncbi:hypothetical protein D3C71_1027000 [compost metagenome]